jgi:ATPase subunit of ABC transporter with duplicated ATPase domains
MPMESVRDDYPWVRFLGCPAEFQGRRAEVLAKLAASSAAGAEPPPKALSLPSQYRPRVSRAQVVGNPRTQSRLSVRELVDTHMWAVTEGNGSDERVCQTMLELRDVHLEKEGSIILNKFSWRVNQGESWILKGLNGAGRPVKPGALLEDES